jgi:hypothetical protein
MRGRCDLPPPRCVGSDAYCHELVLFMPESGPGYEDVSYTEGMWHDRTASYLQRDLMVRVQYAAAKVACVGAGWSSGHGGPVALLDMSESDGSIPGTSRGQPGHPWGTHTDGQDIDIAYYQAHTPDNHVRPVCPSVVDDVDEHHCVGAPSRLDAARTAMFIGALFEQPGIRVVGVDGRIAPLVRADLRQLVAAGHLSVAAAVEAVLHLASEDADGGRGWYSFHHHHLHVSLATDDVIVVDAP